MTVYISIHVKYKNLIKTTNSFNLERPRPLSVPCRVFFVFWKKMYV